MSWAAEEFRTIDLGDNRLNKRTVLLAERLAQKPVASIPNACLNWTETIAAYRYLSHEETRWDKVMEAHWEASEARIREHPVVLCLQDTTELDYHGQQIVGLGPLGYEARRGMYLHPTYVVTPEREPLGVTNAWMWAREFRAEDGSRGGLPESSRWVESYERVAEQAARLPETRHICVSDRESDMMALLVRARELGHAADYLIRSCHNRTLPAGNKLWAQVMESPVLGCVAFTIPAGRGRKARQVRQEIRLRQVALADGKGGAVEVSCLVASEIGCPEHATPVIWRLLTNRQAETLDEACQLVDWYRARWEIELFFLVLKEGCRVEQLQLETIDRLQTALVLYMVIAWRINRLMRLGRTLPELPADLLFEADEWKAAFILNKKRPPKAIPQANAVIRLIAQLGGFLGRKGDGEPGVKTLWRGMQELAVFVEGFRFARHIGFD